MQPDVVARREPPGELDIPIGEFKSSAGYSVSKIEEALDPLGRYGFVFSP